LELKQEAQLGMIVFVGAKEQLRMLLSAEAL
jgi:hypothetical protein